MTDEAVPLGTRTVYKIVSELTGEVVWNYLYNKTDAEQSLFWARDREEFKKYGPLVITQELQYLDGKPYIPLSKVPTGEEQHTIDYVPNEPSVHPAVRLLKAASDLRKMGVVVKIELEYP